MIRLKNRRLLCIIVVVLLILSVLTLLLRNRKVSLDVDLAQVDRVELVFTKGLGGTLSQTALAATECDAAKIRSMYNQICDTLPKIKKSIVTEEPAINGAQFETFEICFLSGENALLTVRLRDRIHTDGEWWVWILMDGTEEMVYRTRKAEDLDDIMELFDSQKIEYYRQQWGETSPETTPAG